jgi:hypothetical protein
VTVCVSRASYEIFTSNYRDSERNDVLTDPTFDDFTDWIDWHIGRAIKHAQEAVNQIRAQATKNGLSQSGARFIQNIEGARNEFETAIQIRAW